jgi:hypothetical protein
MTIDCWAGTGSAASNQSVPAVTHERAILFHDRVMAQLFSLRLFGRFHSNICAVGSVPDWNRLA